MEATIDDVLKMHEMGFEFVIENGQLKRIFKRGRRSLLNRQKVNE